MEEAGNVICLTDTGRKVQPRVSSEQHQTHKVCVWMSKRRAHKTRVSEALPRRRDV